jgi:hypothetical protein
MARYTSSDSVWALPNSAPAEAATNRRPEATPTSGSTVREVRAVYMSDTEPRRWNR